MLIRLHRIQRAEGEADKAIGIRALREGQRDVSSRLDGLVLHDDPPDRHSIQIDVAAGTAPVTISNVPRFARQQPGGRALRNAIYGLPAELILWRLAAENPEIGRSRVEIELEGLRRRADLYGTEVFRVEHLRRSRDLPYETSKSIS